MKHDTLKDIRELENFVFSRQVRNASIAKRATEIAKAAPTMTLREAEEALLEVKELRAEMRENDEYIAKARARIREFYKPATVI